MTVNGGSEGIKLIVVNSVFLGLSCLAVVLRLCARGLRRQSLQLNDWLIMLALICQIGQSVVEDLNGAFGDIGMSPGQGTSTVPTWTNNLNLPGAILWALPMLFIQLSVLHYYYATFPTRKFRWLCVFMMIIALVFFAAYTAVAVLSCIPVSMDWNASGPGYCINIHLRIIITSAVMAGINLVIVLLPLFVLHQLDLIAPQRFLVGIIFLLGLGVCAVAGLRIFYSTVIDADVTNVEAAVDQDITTLLESDVGTIVACLPLLWPLVERCTGVRALSPDSQRTHVNRWTPDMSTLTDDEEMAKRVQREERKPIISKPQPIDLGSPAIVKQYPRHEDERIFHPLDVGTPMMLKAPARETDQTYQPAPSDQESKPMLRAVDVEKMPHAPTPPRVELPADSRRASRNADRNSRDRPLSRILFGLSGSRPLSWRKRPDWPLSDDVERELSSNSGRDSGASMNKPATAAEKRLHNPPVLDHPTAVSEDTVIAISRNNSQRHGGSGDIAEPPPRNPERTRTLDSTTSSLGRKNSAAQRLTAAAASLDQPVAAAGATRAVAPAAAAPPPPPQATRVEPRSSALGGDTEDPSRWDSRTPHSPLRSPIGRSPALTPPPPKRSSPALVPGSAPPVPKNTLGVPQRSKSAKENRSRKPAAPAPAGNDPNLLQVANKKAPLVSNPDVLTPGAPPSPVDPIARRSGSAPPANVVARVQNRRTMPAGSPPNRESVTADLDSEWGKELARSVAAMTREENWL